MDIRELVAMHIMKRVMQCGTNAYAMRNRQMIFNSALDFLFIRGFTYNDGTCNAITQLIDQAIELAKGA